MKMDDVLDVFVEELEDDSLQIQVDAVKRLATVAVALDAEETRSKLIPILEDYIDNSYPHDEVLMTLAEQLETFVPFLGGPEYVSLVLGLLERLCNVDETLVRERAVKSLAFIASTLKTEHLEAHILPLIRKMAHHEWFASRCAASALISICYPTVQPELQKEIKDIFRELVQDGVPLVRKAAALNFGNLIEKADIETVKSEFIPVLDNLTNDNHESIKVLAVNAAIAIAHRLTCSEAEELVFGSIIVLAENTSWRTRCAIAIQMPEIAKAFGPDITRRFLVTMYQDLTKDTENPVREEAAKNIVLFCCVLKEQNASESFEDIFENTILPLVKFLYGDPNETIRSNVALCLMPLISLTTSDKAKKEFVLLVQSSIEHEEYPKVKENLAKNLDVLVSMIGSEDVIQSVLTLMDHLMYRADSRWRIRRDIILAFLHICDQVDETFFNDNLNSIYLRLLKDPVMAVRKTAPLILPMLIKRYGNSWAYNIVSEILRLANDERYLLKYVPLYCIDEIIAPTLDCKILSGKVPKYLEEIRKTVEHEEENVKEEAVKVLARTHTLFKLLKKALEEPWVSKSMEMVDVEEYFEEKIQYYAEETFDALIAHSKYSIIDVTKNDLLEGNKDIIYLEGILHMCNKYFLDTVQLLLKDKVSNVPVRTRHTLSKIIRFVANLESEFGEIWAKELLSKAGPEQYDAKQFKDEVQDEGKEVDLEKEPLERPADNVEELKEQKIDMNASNVDTCNIPISNNLLITAEDNTQEENVKPKNIPEADNDNILFAKNEIIDTSEAK